MGFNSGFKRLILCKEYKLLIALCYFLHASYTSLQCSTHCTHHRLLPAHRWLKTLCWMFNVFAVQRRIFCFQSMFRLSNDVPLYPRPDIIDGYPLMMKCLSVRVSVVAPRCANFHVLRYWARSNINGYLTLKSLAVSLRTTRFNIKKILHGARFALSVLYGYQNRQRLLLYTSLTDWFL